MFVHLKKRNTKINQTEACTKSALLALAAHLVAELRWNFFKILQNKDTIHFLKNTFRCQAHNTSSEWRGVKQRPLHKSDVLLGDSKLRGRRILCSHVNGRKGPCLCVGDYYGQDWKSSWQRWKAVAHLLIGTFWSRHICWRLNGVSVPA